MDNVILGKLENDEKTCSWPTPEREAQTIQILNGLTTPIDKELLENIKKSSLVNAKSDALYKFMLEVALSLECVDKDLNIMLIAEDINTKESIHICHSGETENIPQRIDKLIRLLEKVSIGKRDENGNEVANEIFTIIANVVAMYCASSPETEKSFIDAIQLYKDKIKELQ